MGRRFMFPSAHMKRVRPSLKSLGLSCVVCPFGLYLAAGLFGDYFYIPIAAVLAVALAVVWVRLVGFRAALPKPYGEGRVSTTDAKAAARNGLLIVLGGVLGTIVLFGSVFFLPPIVFFAVVFGVIAGFPLSEIVFFVLVTRYERISDSKIFLITEEVEGENGEESLVKTLQMRNALGS